jgi:RNA polymerase sigma-70 factor (ECF subfamily)
MDRLKEDNSKGPSRSVEEAEVRDAAGLDVLLAQHRERLRRMVRVRLDARLNGRIDASDVIQEAYLQAARRFEEYLRDSTMPFFLWLRFLVGEQLTILHRHHLNVRMRDARREVSLQPAPCPEASSVALAAQLLAREMSPSDAVERAERFSRLQQAIERLNPLDREILSLRHFEQLSRSEAAAALGIGEAAASKRYIRALSKLKGLFGETSIPSEES